MLSRYRAEIDGLRALAVLPVVLFHAGAGGLSGGFVGVDVFFVISGFLITKILMDEADVTGGVSLSDFYARRFRRIAPALLFVLVASLAIAHLILLPGQYVAFAKSVLATLGFSSNFWFWSQTGYFAAQAGLAPLLHTWSLAVEEQFYLFAPVVIGLLSQSRRWLIRLFLASAFLSFAISIFGVWFSPSVTFYWLPTRAWELLLGSLLATQIVPAVSRVGTAQILAVVGLFLIAGSMVVLNETFAFPGPAALPVCLGTALIIYATEFHRTAVGDMLSSPGLVGIGRISYSLYLWHWPVMVFSRVYFGAGSPAWATVTLSLGLAVATFFLVERPTRQRWATRPLLIGIPAVTAALLIGALLVIRSGGVPSRLPARAVRLAAATEDRATICANRADWCDTAFGPNVAIVGDSHAALLAEAYDEAGQPVRLLSSNTCPPGWEIAGMPPRDAQACRRRNTTAIDRLLSDPMIKSVVLVANWPSYDAADITSHTGEMVLRIRRAGKLATVVFGLPYMNGVLPVALAQTEWRNDKPPQLLRPPPFKIPGAQMIDAGSVLCNGSLCPPIIGGHVVLSDGNHVTRTIARTRIRLLVN